MEQVLVCTGSQANRWRFVGWLLMFVCRFVESGAEYYDCLLNGRAAPVSTRLGRRFYEHDKDVAGILGMFTIFVAKCIFWLLISGNHHILNKKLLANADLATDLWNVQFSYVLHIDFYWLKHCFTINKYTSYKSTYTAADCWGNLKPLSLALCKCL